MQSDAARDFFTLDKNDNHFQKLDIAEHFSYNSVMVHRAGKTGRKQTSCEPYHNSKDRTGNFCCRLTGNGIE